MREDQPDSNLPERAKPSNRPVPMVTGTVSRSDSGRGPIAPTAFVLPTGRQILLHLCVACCLGALVTGLITANHQSEREEAEEIDPIIAFNEAPAFTSPAEPIAAPLLESVPPVAAVPQPTEASISDAAAIDDVRSPSMEIVSPPKVYKEKDKLLVLHKEDEVVERYINFTPDVIDAAIRCDTSRVRELLGQGADVNSSDERGDSVLAWAVKRECIPVVTLLLERGAHVNTISRNGFTPYVWSRLYRYPQLSSILKAAGADTELGSYWWRHEEDGSGPWMRATYEALCKNQLCN